MPAATPTRIVEPFAVNAGAGFIQNPIPVASQLPANPGRASFNDGFTPLNMTPVASGGIPPAGKDMNGILFMISAHTAALNAGQWYQYDATLSAAIGGYAIGAILQQAADPNAFWISVVNNNVTDPDTGGAGWMSTKPLYDALPLAAGAHNDVVLPGPSDYVLDYTLAGAANITGFIPQRDNQQLVISPVGSANVLTMNALNADSAAAHRIRAAADVPLAQNQPLKLQYSTGAGLWLVV